MMASVEKVILLAITIVIGATLTYGRAIELDEKNSIELKAEPSDDFDEFYKQFQKLFNPPTVSHFATHNLCKRMRSTFEYAMSKKLRNMTGSFVKQFVHNLCDRTPHTMLKLWVAELFDADANGFIDEHEKLSIVDRNYED